MSVKALSAVFEDSRAQDAAFTVLLALADWADHNGWCYPSYGQIATKARVSKATAKRSVADLLDLGELERVTKGKPPVADEDDVGLTVRVQARNLYRIALLKRKSEVVSPRDHPSTPDQTRQVVSSATAGGVIQTPEVVSLAHAHIRNRPSGDPSERPSGRRAPTPDRCETFRGLWNELVTDPIRQVHTLTPRRRRHIRARLVEHTLDQHREAIASINASSYCRGRNAVGYVLQFDHYIGAPDAAIKALEGQYDDGPVRPRPGHLTATPFICPHTPSCLSRSACDVQRRIDGARAS